MKKFWVLGSQTVQIISNETLPSGATVCVSVPLCFCQGSYCWWLILELRLFPEVSHAWRVILKVVWRADVWPGPGQGSGWGSGLVPQAPLAPLVTQHQLPARARTLIYGTGGLPSNQPWGPPRWWHRTTAVQTTHRHACTQIQIDLCIHTSICKYIFSQICTDRNKNNDLIQIKISLFNILNIEY